MLVGLSFSCSDDFFDLKPQGRASKEQLSNKNGVNALLIGTYSLLDGVGAGNTGRQSTISNYVFGGISSDDSYKVPTLVTSPSNRLSRNGISSLPTTTSKTNGADCIKALPVPTT